TGITCTSAGAPGTDTISLPITLVPGSIPTQVLPVSGCTLTLSGPISGTSNLVLGNDFGATGTVVLSGNDSYTGNTSVAIETIVDGTLSNTNVNIHGQTAGVGGGGTIAGSVT